MPCCFTDKVIEPFFFFLPLHRLIVQIFFKLERYDSLSLLINGYQRFWYPLSDTYFGMIISRSGESRGQKIFPYWETGRKWHSFQFLSVQICFFYYWVRGVLNLPHKQVPDLRLLCRQASRKFITDMLFCGDLYFFSSYCCNLLSLKERQAIIHFACALSLRLQSSWSRLLAIFLLILESWHIFTISWSSCMSENA